MASTPTTMLPLGKVTLSPGAQARAVLDSAHVADLADDLDNGAEFPPVVVFHDGQTYWLASGWHRWHAHKRSGRSHIECDVRPGTLDDAALHAAASNAANGLRRSPSDKRRAVQLTHSVRPSWSVEQIAAHCSVSAASVQAIVAFADLPDPEPVVPPTAADLLASGYQAFNAAGSNVQSGSSRVNAQAFAAPARSSRSDGEDDDREDGELGHLLPTKDRLFVLSKVLRLLRKLDRYSDQLGVSCERLLREFETGKLQDLVRRLERG